MNTTRLPHSLAAAAIVGLALSGCATTQAAAPDPAPQRAPSAQLDSAAAILQNDNDPRGYHGLASISGMTGMPTQTSESSTPPPTPRVNDNDPRGHHRLPAIEGADGFGVPAPRMCDVDPRGHHVLSRLRR
ncbi:hypothetical protein [Agromyces humatus]|uniref:Lipoprotein n=1 Tax=Agromyces humatus TaxID=279573 RepID=A0ABP4X1E5_9MICO|nr:hypothetical protein [Agromyces humatus]